MAEKIVKDSQGLAKDLVNDCISRQAAIDALAKFVPYAICDESTESYTNGLTDAYNLICQLPSAQPERKRGKWEIYVISLFDGVGCRCSECGFEGVPYWDFCPNCGADMRGEQDE